MAKQLYTLTRPYYDNTKLHKRGAKCYFEEGKAPKTAKLTEEVQLAAAMKAAVKPAKSAK